MATASMPGADTDGTGSSDVVPNARMPLEIASINKRLDDIILGQTKKPPWYRDTGVFISVAAFFISVATSTLSAVRTYQQDINSKRDALHAAIQQYNVLQLHGLEIQIGLYKDQIGLPKDDADAHDQKYGVLQNWKAVTNNAVGIGATMLARQVLDATTSLGRNASSVDLGEAAIVLNSSAQPEVALLLDEKAVAAAKTAYEYVGAGRGLAQAQFVLGKVHEANATMEQTLAVFSIFPDDATSDGIVASFTAQSYLWWVGMVGVSDCELSRRNLAKAREALAKYPAVYASQQDIIESSTALLSKGCK